MRVVVREILKHIQTFLQLQRVFVKPRFSSPKMLCIRLLVVGVCVCVCVCVCACVRPPVTSFFENRASSELDSGHVDKWEA